MARKFISNINIVNINININSGDSSAVARWTVDQEVVGWNPTHGENLISVVRSLSGFTQPIWQNEYRLSVAGVLHIELGLKIRIYVLR